MAKKLDPELEQLVRDFTDELAGVFRERLIEAVESSVSAEQPKRRGRPPSAKTTRRKTAPKTSAPKTTRKKRGTKKTARKATSRRKASSRRKGQKRSPAELDRLTSDLYREIKKNPNARIEQLSESMGVPTKELTLPAKKLIEDKKVKTKGQRRGTTYRAA